MNKADFAVNIIDENESTKPSFVPYISCYQAVTPKSLINEISKSSLVFIAPRLFVDDRYEV